MNFDAITRFAADGILNSFLAGIGIAMLAWAVNRLFSRQGSGTRFVVWLLALLAIGIVPFAGNLASTNAAPKITSPSVLALPQSFATYLFVAWIIGATLGLLHVAHGLYRLRRLRATCTPVDLDQLDATSRAILNEACAPPAGVTDDRRICACRSGLLPSVGDRVGIHRPVTLCTSNAVRVPAAIGYFRPMVVFPTWALSELPPAELNAILLHELAHLRRWDDFTNLAQKIVKAIFFFHPAVWFIESRLTLEREMACDDAVLAASFSPRAYAESLVGLAEKSFLRRGVQLAQAAVSHVQQLKLRLAEILRKDKTQQGSARIGKPAVALMSLIGIISFYGVAHAPRLVAFSSDDQQIASAPTIAEHAIANDVDAQLRPVTLRYTVRPSSTPRADVLKAHTSANKHGAPRVAKKNELRVLRASVVMPVSALQSRSDGGALVASGASRWIAMPNDLQAAERPTAAPVLVVFHAQQFSADGPIFWRVTIVHLTPAQQRAITGGIAKQI
jgi:beta-lactamase regulating signal transducer with metallopeptidase domain